MSASPPAPPAVGLDNYGLYPLGLTPIETMRWAAGHGAEGVAFSGLPPEQAASLTPAALRELASFAGEHGLYLEWGGGQHIPRDMGRWARKDLFEVNRAAAAQAALLGTRVVRSCSGGLMRWSDDSPATETLLRETAASLVGQRGMLRDHGVVLAIETHFEFTSHELVRLLEMCEADPGDWLGICLDTMNLLTMAEEPVRATRRLLPWVVSTHIKDGGIRVDGDGLTTFTAPVGKGVVDLRAILAMLTSLPRPVHLSVEDHGGDFLLPIYDPLFLSRFPDLEAGELAALVQLGCRTAEAPACRPLPRAAWPEVCERRLVDDLEALRTLAAEAFHHARA
jgi:sugar phosphate isomerase/epimerase